MNYLRWLKEWRKFSQGSRKVLTMNQRNLHLIYPNNAREHFPMADNKLLTKEILTKCSVPIPETYTSYSSFYELQNLVRDLADHDQFVIKPAQGSGGGGIMVIASKQDDAWVSVSGHKYSEADIRKHIADIIFGVYSFGLTDQAIIEARVEQHSELTQLSPFGLADVRVIAYHEKPVLAMLRVPTQGSDGKANLHQGALGIGIDLETGHAIHAIHEGAAITHHPDSGEELLGWAVPCWKEIIHFSKLSAAELPLKYLGIDLAISSDGPLILEVNARPGIEIQNANMLGMHPRLEQIEMLKQQDNAGGCL